MSSMCPHPVEIVACEPIDFIDNINIDRNNLHITTAELNNRFMSLINIYVNIYVQIDLRVSN